MGTRSAPSINKQRRTTATSHDFEPCNRYGDAVVAVVAVVAFAVAVVVIHELITVAVVAVVAVMLVMSLLLLLLLPSHWLSLIIVLATADELISVVNN